MEDKKITELFLLRDGRAAEAAQEKYGAYLSAISSGILSDERDAEECVNDALLAAWQSIPPHKPEDLRTYLSKLCRRAALKRIRENSAKKRGGGEMDLALEELEEIIPGEADEEDSKAIREVLDRFLSELSYENRRVFVMRYFYLYGVALIAQKCGCGESKVKMSLMRSREKLRKMLLKENLL